MDFLKKMKSREMIEMGLKTIMSVVVCLIFIILMEGMIFGIYMNKIKENKNVEYAKAQAVVYCHEIEDNKYEVYVHTEDGAWFVQKIHPSKADIEGDGYKQVFYRKPNAFDVSVQGSHYVVMAILVAGVIGFYCWRFYNLGKGYKKLEAKYQKTGKIFGK